MSIAATRRYVSDEQALGIIKARFNAIPNPVSADDELLVRKVYDILRKQERVSANWQIRIRNWSLTAASIALFVQQFLTALKG